jgi:cobalt-precorrin 5A hydrolase
MKVAIISVTYKGALLADKLAKSLDFKVDVYAKAGRNKADSGQTFDSLSHLIQDVFNHYDGFVFIMATGIVVRVIAPHIQDKRFDPAVVVMDDGGQHAISLLSGHIGRANELALTVGKAVDAVPVITTATDVAGLPAADVLAVKLDLVIEPFEQLKTINAAIVNGDRVAFFIDRSLANYTHFYLPAVEMGVRLFDMDELEITDEYDSAVVITDKELYMTKPHLYLRPATLAIGIGCRRGTTSAEILTAIESCCRKIGRSPKSIALMGTTLVKQDEVGLLAAAQQLEVPLKFFTNDELQQCITEQKFTTSSFVEEQIGVGSVCEPAAILGGQANSLLLARTVHPQITIAIAEVKCRWWE